ncbi:MAG: hypothetical protein Q9165_004296 [Trypethelium subeluteriae]
MALYVRFQSIFNAVANELYTMLDEMVDLKRDLKLPAHRAKIAARRLKYCEPEIIAKPTPTSEILRYVLLGALLAFVLIYFIELLAAGFLYGSINDDKGASFRRLQSKKAHEQTDEGAASTTRQELDDSDERLYAEALSPGLQPVVTVSQSQVLGSGQLREEQKFRQFMLERPGLFVHGMAFYVSLLVGMMTWEGKITGQYPFFAQYKALKDRAVYVLSYMKALGNQKYDCVRTKIQTTISSIVEDTMAKEAYIHGKVQLAKEFLIEKFRKRSRAAEDKHGSSGDSGKEDGTKKVPTKVDGLPKNRGRLESIIPRLRRP